MKRNAITAALLCLSLLLTMTACGKSAPENKGSIETPEQEYSNPSEITEGSDDYVPEQANSKILIAYFSVPEDVNIEGVDAVSGASVVVKDGEKLGNTQYVAQLIHEVVGGDLFRIETTNEYPLEHDALLSYASEEQSKSARQELITQVEDFGQYDVILLGYPNWWYDMPMPVYTFLESYDFHDKTIIPFITHGGSRASGTLDTIGELAPEAEIYKEPLILSRNDVAGSGDTVKSWAESLGICTEEETTMDNTATEFNLAAPTPGEEQTIYLWEEGKMPCPREYSSAWNDPEDFKPNMEYRPVKEGIEVKGAVMLCAGGAFAFRGNQWDTYPTADKLNELGYQCFVVQYRLRPFTQEEGALDLARAVRYVRYYADEYGIDPSDIAVVGYSAGGILCGEQVLNWKGSVTPVVLDENYVPDALDLVSADAAAIGHIYSFYGRLSVGSTDVEKFRQSNLPPTFYAYGTEDPFYRQFMANADAVCEAGVSVEEHCYDGQPHGFGAGNEYSNWVPEFDRWLIEIYENN